MADKKMGDTEAAMQELHEDEATREGAAAPPAPGRPKEDRAVITLPPPVATATRRMGDQLGGAQKAEVVRRGLMLLDLMLSLRPNEELVVRNTDTGECERLRFSWQTF